MRSKLYIELKDKLHEGALSIETVRVFGITKATENAWRREPYEINKKELRKCLLSGMSQLKIDEKFGLPKRTVGYWLKEHPEFKEVVEQEKKRQWLIRYGKRLRPYYAGEKKQKAIAKRYKVTQCTVSEWVKKHQHYLSQTK